MLQCQSLAPQMPHLADTAPAHPKGIVEDPIAAERLLEASINARNPIFDTQTEVP